jgi:hypothetical protein
MLFNISSFNFRIGNWSFNFSVWKFQNWPCYFFKVAWLFSVTSNFIPILIVCYFVKIVTGTSCLFENFCLHISTSCIGFLVSAQNVVYPCQERCTEYVCPSDCSSPCDIFYFILFNFLVWFIVSCLVWSGRVFSEWWTIKDLEGTSHDLINHYPSICLDKLKKTM